MKSRPVFFLVLGSIVAVIGLGLLAAGANLGWAYGTQRDNAGFFTTSNERFETDSFALTSDNVDLGQPGRKLGVAVISSTRDGSSTATFDTSLAAVPGRHRERPIHCR